MQGNRKTKVGRVVSDKMDKTIVVSGTRRTIARILTVQHERKLGRTA